MAKFSFDALADVLNEYLQKLIAGILNIKKFFENLTIFVDGDDSNDESIDHSYLAIDTIE